MLNVLVADDEEIARNIILILLERRADIGKIWTAENGESALALAQQHNPDLIFLDIEMPILNGIMVAAHAPKESAVIFTTAYNQFAVKAFELNAVDYLLKPYADNRFNEAIERAKTRHTSGRSNLEGKLDRLLNMVKSEQPALYSKKLVVRESKRIRLFNFEDIAYVKGAGNYVEIHFQDKQMHLFRITMNQVEKQLPSNQFSRVHKSVIANLELVTELKSTGQGEFELVLKNGAKIPISRRLKGTFERFLIDPDG